MSYTKKYLDKVRGEMNQGYRSMNGQRQVGRARNAVGSQLANGPSHQNNFFSAAGAQNQATTDTTPQYIIQISNSSASTFTGGFDIFGASQYLFNSAGTWANGSFTLNGITISSLFTTVTYQQILTASMTQPFTSGGVYLQSISGNTNQVSDVYTLTSQSPGGELYSKPIKPYLSPNQFQNGITYNTSAFNITALTKLTWTNIYANAVFQISILPAQVIDPGAGLNGASVQKQYGQPSLIGKLY